MHDDRAYRCPRPGPGRLMGRARLAAMRVAVPLEQCWHEVPGGTARASIDLVSELDRRSLVELVGVAARHRRPPAPQWRPPIPVRQLPLPRLALYEAWHAVRRPRVERATGPVDVLHCMGGAIAAGRAPLVVTLHDLAFVHHPELFTRHGRRFFDRALALTRAEAAAVIVPSQATLDDCVRAGIDRARLHHVPWGIDVEPQDGARSTRHAPGSGSGGSTWWWWGRSSRARTSAGCSRRGAASTEMS